MLDLPIADYRQEILESVDTNQVTIITAETGAGKSTQVPQYLAEHGYLKVVITQPRILAARNLAERVSQEWVNRFSADVVGYRTAHERNDTEQTVILYCTDGLQLVREITGEGTGERQVLVLDEIHEWNQNMEVLIAWAKKRCQEDPAFKLLIMSATIDAKSLANYFKAGIPITVPGRSYPITIRQGHDLVDEIINQFQQAAPNLLVFLPGKSEIEQVAARLSPTISVPIIPLHSQLTAEQQQLAFANHPAGKIVLSTNIAQTSITIDDIDTVIDSGLERRIEIKNGVEGLFIGQISQADCLQRAGRAGRTKPGNYVLAALDRLPCSTLNMRSAYAVPEITRIHLDRLVLRLANVGIDIEELEFFHAPPTGSIIEAKQTLLTLGAMTADHQVTGIGEKMERFPVESRYARMLVEAEKAATSTRLKLLLIIAIQEVGGIVRGGSRSLGWLQFTGQNRSDLLAQYDLYVALAHIDPEEWEQLGVIAKNVEKATEVMERMAGAEVIPVEPIKKSEEVELVRYILAGQIDQVWSVSSNNEVVSFSGGRPREFSGGSVVKRMGLIIGTPFDLEVQTGNGLETLHLVQGITAIDPSWLVAVAPEYFKAQPKAVFFDSTTGTLARSWLVIYRGKLIKGISAPLLEQSKENKQLFVELLAKWIYVQVEESRHRLQKKSGQRRAAVPLHRVNLRVKATIGGVVSLDEISEQQYRTLMKLKSFSSYTKQHELLKKSDASKRGVRR